MRIPSKLFLVVL